MAAVDVRAGMRGVLSGAALDSDRGESLDSDNSDIQDGGVYLELPSKRESYRHHKPKFYLDKNKEAEPVVCGGGDGQAFRFSQTGVVEVRRVLKRNSRAITSEEAAERKSLRLPARKTMDEQVWYVVDAIDGRRTPLTEYLRLHLVPMDTAIPGWGWMGLPVPTPEHRASPAQCHTCGKVCGYPSGDAAVTGGKRTPDTLYENEWARLSFTKKPMADEDEAVREVLSLFGGRAVEFVQSYAICTSCIPKNFVYCSWCNKIHRAWHTAEPLREVAALLASHKRGELPKTLWVRQYNTRQKDWQTGEEAWIRKPEHAGERISELVEFVGKGIICQPRRAVYADNVNDYLSELRQIQKWANHGQKDEENHDPE